MTNIRIRRARVIALALISALLTSGLAACGTSNSGPHSDGRTFWELLTPRDSGGSGAPLYDEIGDVIPGTSNVGGFRPAAAVIDGPIIAIEPGIAYAAGEDAQHSVIVPYDSADAAVRFVKLVVQVEKVRAGKLTTAVQDGKIRINIPQPNDVTIDQLIEAINTAGRGIFHVSNALERAQATGDAGNPEIDPAYYSQVYQVIGNAMFLETSPGAQLIHPLLEDDEFAQQLLQGDTTLAEFRQSVDQIACARGQVEDRSIC